jgi:cellulose synthase/poly-beta-1,6-N-acetylglucosamine synthase-like glycosyltransferase
MVTFFSILLLVLAVLFAIPITIFFVEVVAAIALPSRDYSASFSQHLPQSVAVIVPAHNESTALLPTLVDIKPQLGARDRLLVVADNCSDDTAAVASAAGADVIERNDPNRTGKGYALAWGIRHLALDPPDIVIVIDADCRVPRNSIYTLAASCGGTNRPVQSLSNMIMRDDSPIDTRVAEFAWRVKNYVRPHGLNNLGLPCQLMGTGMAFPWNTIYAANLASGSIVEDLKLGLELALAGSPAVFCPFPGVISDFPFTVEALQSQRLRWEQGHISTILTTVPRLICSAIARARLGLLVLALDAMVPPLSLLGMLLIGMSVVTGLATFLGISAAAMWISCACLLGLIALLFIVWLKYGREILPPASLCLILPHVFGKIFLYRKILFRKSDLEWIRADRKKI